jgi:hypothetical protein
MSDSEQPEHETEEYPVPSGDRLGHLEYPAETWPTLKMMPGKTPPPDPAGVKRWAETIARATDPGTLAMMQVEHQALLLDLDSPEVGGSGKARALFMDTDPPGSAATPLGGPGLDLCRTCLTPIAEPSPKCTNPFNHQQGQA